MRGVIAAEHGLEVVAMVAQRHELRRRSELARTDHVAQEGRPAADDLVARLEEDLRQAVDQPVRAGAGHDLLEADAVPLGQGPAEPVGAAVRVAVEVGVAR